MEANERYQLQIDFYAASRSLNVWAMARKAAKELATISPEHWIKFKEVASEKVDKLVSLGGKLLEDTELDETQRKALENKILGARHFEESLVP